MAQSSPGSSPSVIANGPPSSPSPGGAARLANSSLRQSMPGALGSINNSPLAVGTPLRSSLPSYGAGGYASPYYGATPTSRFGMRSTYGYGAGYGSGYGAGYGSGYGTGYGSGYGSGYGTGLGRMYGGGMYGSRMGGMYGSRFGGGGMMYGQAPGMMGAPLLGPDGQPVQHPLSGLVETGMSKMQIFYSFIESFGRFAEVLEMNFDAFHGSFASVVAFLDTIGELWHRMYWAVSAFTFFKFVRILAARVRDYFNRASGKPALAKDANLSDALDAFASFEQEQQLSASSPSSSSSSSSSSSWFLPMLIGVALLVGGPILINKLIRRLFAREFDQLEAEEQQQQRQLQAFPLPTVAFPFEAQALRDYQAQNFGDLEFQQGETIAVLGQAAPGWYHGAIGDRQGHFPSVFVASPTPTASSSL